MGTETDQLQQQLEAYIQGTTYSQVLSALLKVTNIGLKFVTGAGNVLYSANSAFNYCRTKAFKGVASAQEQLCTGYNLTAEAGQQAATVVATKGCAAYLEILDSRKTQYVFLFCAALYMYLQMDNIKTAKDLTWAMTLMKTCRLLCLALLTAKVTEECTKYHEKQLNTTAAAVAGAEAEASTEAPAAAAVAAQVQPAAAQVSAKRKAGSMLNQVMDYIPNPFMRRLKRFKD